MSGSTEARLKNGLSTLAASAVSPCGEPENTEDLGIDDAGIHLLIDFFLQLKKWDKLQSTRMLSGVPESDKDIAA